MTDLNQLIEKVKELGAAAASIINTSDIRFSEEFRKLCEENSCGKYGTNWMCPPAVEPLEVLKAKVLKLSEGFVFQTVYRLEDSFDYYGMIKAGEIHDKIFRSILEYIQSDKAVASVESYGIDVNALVTSCGIAYNNGPNTVSLVGLFLF